jgi:hypothetical protein
MQCRLMFLVSGGGCGVVKVQAHPISSHGLTLVSAASFALGMMAWRHSHSLRSC